MNTSTVRRRCVIGRDLVVIETAAQELYVESALRLRPGADVELCGEMRGIARVETWSVARLGQEGPVFRGVCRLVSASG